MNLCTKNHPTDRRMLAIQLLHGNKSINLGCFYAALLHGKLGRRLTSSSFFI